ncbi:trypsin-like peptidase domain-containing protein [Actibacterium ureilyticum]|uniref:trypsin-like peptidase domain-containing protein n=1 Tax=Actibacterium ureilyticum TaxID=1590614 RepID=UPI000BAAFF83|nr:trypsin-like peptidase domain-containing protein [Actibacterium ureilyticum]
MRVIAAAIIGLLMWQPVHAETRVPGDAQEITLSFAPVVRQSAPAVVNIYARRVVSERRATPFANDPFFRDFFREFGRSAPRVQNSLGSGVVLSADGLVVSNYHVVGQATEIRVVLNDRREFDAQVLLADQEADLAILKLQDARDLPALELRDSDTLEVGELVLAIGNPFGIGQTVSSGIVSGLARAGTSIGSGRGLFIQTDAAINPGNSGGALVDTAGRLIGINTAILTRSGGSNGVGFAIPSNLVAQFVAQALDGQDQFLRPWAGVTGQAVDAALAEVLGQDIPQGVVLSGLHPASPFAKAGLQVGDIVLRIGDDPVNSPQEMMFYMTAAGIGADIDVHYLSDGSAETTRVAMVAAPETPPRRAVTIGARSTLAGLAAVNVNPAVAHEYKLSVDQGVVITDPGPVGGRVGLRAGDVLLSVNGDAIADTADLERAAASDRRGWSVEYIRGGRRSVLRFRV